MVQVKIKGLTNGVHVYAQFDDEVLFLMEMEERLKAFSCQKKAVEAFFHIAKLSDQGLLSLFQLCNRFHMIIKSMDEGAPSTMQLKQGNVYNGQCIELTGDTLWIGDIHAGSFVSSEGSLYVIGKIEGTIDLLHETAVLASNNIQANVRICDSRFHNVTSFAPIKAYYHMRSVKVEHMKEELYGRGHCNCVW